MSQLYGVPPLPSGWVLRPLKYLAIPNAESLPDHHPPDEEIRYIDIGSVSRGGLVEEPEILRFGDAPSRARRILRSGDVLVSSVRTYLRAVMQADTDFDGYVASTGFSVLRPKRHVDPRYLYYWCMSDPFIETVVSKSTGVSYPAISASELTNLPVALPPTDMQRRVADMLDAETARIDTLIEKNDAARQLAETKLREEIATAVTLGLDTGGRRETGTTWAPEIHASWDWAPYQYFAELGSGHTPSRSREDLWMDCTIPWITTADVKWLRDHRREFLDDTEHYVSEAGIAHSAARLLPARTVVVSRTASVGFSAVMARAMATSQDFFTWTCDEHRLLPEYLLYVLRAMKFRGHFDRLMYGSTHKTIYFPDLVELRGPIPPVEDQRAIVDYVRKRSHPIHQLIDRVQQMNDSLRLRRQALITAAVTGEIEV